MTEPTLYPESGFCRLRMDISYDGTHFAGWAKQPDRRTVQECVEDAIATVSRITPETIVAGRTDAGVHATGQVIHVDIPESVSLDDLPYKLNRILDEDVRIHSISIAPEAFHARFSALRRYYRLQHLFLKVDREPYSHQEFCTCSNGEELRNEHGMLLGQC